MSFVYFDQFIFLLLRCMSSLHILEINSMSDTWLATIFSHSAVYLFALLFLLVCRSLLVWCNPTLYLLLLLVLLMSYPKKTVVTTMSRSFFPAFTSSRFIVWGLISKSLILWVDFCVLCEINAKMSHVHGFKELKGIWIRTKLEASYFLILRSITNQQ